jgi:hypothetical protein
MRVMKTQEQIREEIDRLLEEDRLEEAEVLAERLIPISAEEFLKRLDEAPLDDEPVTAEQRAALDRAWEIIRRGSPALDARQSG